MVLVMLVFCSGCDTLSYYRATDHNPAMGLLESGNKASFFYKSEAHGVEMQGSVFLFNFEIVAEIEMKNTGKNQLNFVPSEARLKSLVVNKSLGLKQVRWGSDRNDDKSEDPLTAISIQPQESKHFIFRFDAAPLLPFLRTMKGSKLEKLELNVGSLKRDNIKLKAISVVLKKETR